MEESTIFISYSHKDKDWVKDWFLPRFETNGFQTHIDYRDFEIGQPSLVNMERAVETCDKTILVCSPDYIDSEFCQFEAILLQTEDPIGVRKKILPLMFHDCQLPKRLKMFTYADFRDETEWETQLERLKAQIKKDLEGEKEEKRIYSPPDKVDIIRLPQTGYELFGRQKELALLNDAWESETIKVIAFVAYGGTGKSTLVNKWLEKMRWDNYRGAKRVFAWSFYSQGTGERVTSADLFIKEALVWFGDENPEVGSPWEKGKRLENLIRQDKTLLILDGLEPLQSYLDLEKGKIKDPALAVLVTELAKNNNGLCIITTRETIPDILRFPSSAPQVNLEQISDEAGRALLRVRGILGTDAELEGVSRAFGNHALAINLLAEYLRLIPGNPAEKAYNIPDLDIPEEQGKHPRRVIEAFAAHFGEGAELELLLILGLFDRPADIAAIDAVVQGKSIRGLTKHLNRMSEGQRLKLLQKLRDIKLIAPESHHRPDTVDCHPLIREHFNQKLQDKSQKVWKKSNNRLYKFYRNLPKKLYGKYLPDTLEEMEPLILAIKHACKAGRHNEALNKIYWKRIERKDKYYTRNIPGSSITNLTIISNFFEIHWNQPVSNIHVFDQIFLLGEAGFTLRALGYLREAYQPMQVSFKYAARHRFWKSAAIDAGNLSELCLMLGEVKNAVSYAKESVKFADNSRNKFQQESKRATLASALHQQGDLTKALELFYQAEKIKKRRKPNFPYLYSLSSFEFYDLLLDQGHYEVVKKRAKQTLEYSYEKGSSLLFHGLDKLSLAKVFIMETLEYKSTAILKNRKIEYLKNYTESDLWKLMKIAENYLENAIADLRKFGLPWFIIFGLLTRVLFSRIKKEFTKARDELEEVREIVDDYNMKLHLTDYHLETVRFFLQEWEIEIGERRMDEAERHLVEAKKLVEETGYHRRDPELLLLQAQLHFARGDKENARIWLNKAKQRFDEMGIRMWDWAVRELEEKLRG